RAAARLAHGRLELLAEGEDLVRELERDPTFIGQLEAAAALPEQAAAEPRLEQLDLARERLRRRVQLLAGAHHAARVSNGPEVVEVLEVHGRGRGSWHMQVNYSKYPINRLRKYEFTRSVAGPRL